MPPSPKTPAAALPSAPGTKRAVGRVVFRERIEIEGIGRIKLLIAGTPVKADAYSPEVPCPVMYRDSDTQELVIGEDRFPLASGLIESYRLASAVKTS